MSTISSSRRRAIKLAVLGAAAVPLARLAVTPASASPPKLDESNPTAMALGYRHDTNEVDAAKYPNHSADQRCDNCNLIQGPDGEEWRPCAIFPGTLVAAGGWCAAWVKKVG
ncbi:MAG TPA: high-potential iron-sulfur protein [Xanthomonadaceae bacterium]|nr:high-potential iron-sulfur protein [Xanthomonadaceae bacterium]